MGRGRSSAELHGPPAPQSPLCCPMNTQLLVTPSPGSHSGSRKFATEHLGPVPASLCLRMFCSSKGANLDRNQHSADW